MNDKITEIRKRNGSPEAFDAGKIRNALRKAFSSTDETINEEHLDALTSEIVGRIEGEADVEQVQDLAEKVLMENGFFNTAKSYILYRQQRAQKREVISRIINLTAEPALKPLIRNIQKDFPEPEYDLERLYIKAAELIRPDQPQMTRLSMLERAAAELVSRNAPKWELIAARILNFELEKQISASMKELGISSWIEKLRFLSDQNLLNNELLNV